MNINQAIFKVLKNFNKPLSIKEITENVLLIHKLKATPSNTISAYITSNINNNDLNDKDRYYIKEKRGFYAINPVNKNINIKNIKASDIGELQSRRKKLVKDLIQRYTNIIEKHIEAYQEDECYKYEAVSRFKKEFNLKKLESKTLNRFSNYTINLTSGGAFYRPVTILKEILDSDKTFLIKELENLFNEKIKIETRIDNFYKTLEDKYVNKIKGQNIKYFQGSIDVRFISLLLALKYPNKYVHIKPGEMFDLAKELGYQDLHKKNISLSERFNLYTNFYKSIKKELTDNKKYISLHTKILKNYEYKDSSFNWASVDFVFNVMKIDLEKRLIQVEKNLKIKNKREKEEIANLSKTIKSNVSKKQLEEIENIVEEKYWENKNEADVERLLERILSDDKNNKFGYKEISKKSKIRIDNETNKLYVKIKENFVCQVCGFYLEYKNKQGKIKRHIHADHILEKAKKGTESIQNLWVLCPNCHAKKTYGVIKVDLKNKKVFENGKEIKIKDSHLFV